MSDLSDYEIVTNSRFSDRDVERLLSGRAPEDQELVVLAPLMRMLRTQEARDLDQERLEGMASAAAEIARSTRPSPTDRAGKDGTLLRKWRKPLKKLTPKIATALGSLLVVSGMTGVAVASDEAAPGDALYGIDRALERVGIGDGAEAERVEEAAALVGRDQAAEALEHVAQALADSEEKASRTEGEAEGDQSTAEAAEALEAAADELRNIEEGSDHAKHVRENVANMLEYIANTERGPGFGLGVAALARNISTEDDVEDAGELDTEEQMREESQHDAGPPEGAPAGPPEDVPPGPPETTPAGPPESTPAGPPESTPAGPPPGAGPPAGRP